MLYLVQTNLLRSLNRCLHFFHQATLGGPAFTQAMCETTTHLIVCVEDPTGMELKTDNNCEAVRLDESVKMCSDPAGMWLFETFYLPFLS